LLLECRASPTVGSATTNLWNRHMPEPLSTQSLKASPPTSFQCSNPKRKWKYHSIQELEKRLLPVRQEPFAAAFSRISRVSSITRCDLFP
jgi:hypothetical protein